MRESVVGILVVGSRQLVVGSIPDWEHQSKKLNLTKKGTAMNMRNISNKHSVLYLM